MVNLMAKHRILVLVIVVVLVFTSITGCSTFVNATLDVTQSGDESNTEENLEPDIKDIIEGPQSEGMKLMELLPALVNHTHISVYTPGGMELGATGVEEGLPGGIYAPTNESQAQKIVGFLADHEDTEFVEVKTYSGDKYFLMSSPVLIANEQGSYVFYITASVDDNSIFYVVLLPIQKTPDLIAGEKFLPVRFFRGQSGDFPIRAYRDALNDVLFDTNDMPNIAVIEMLNSDEPEHILNKWRTAQFRHTLDNVLRLNGTVQSDEGLGFDVKVTIGDTIYYLDSVSGFFSMENSRVSMLSRLDDDSLTKVMMRISQYRTLR